MTLVVILIVGAGMLAAVGLAVQRTHRLPGAHAMPRKLPHRPALDAAPAAGPRHRVDDAHTASIDAGEVLRLLQEQAQERHALMLQRAEHVTTETMTPRGRR